MQAIQIHATPQHDYGYLHKVGLSQSTPVQVEESTLDEALAVVLHAVRQSRNPHAMDALGTLLGYMESLEKRQGKIAGSGSGCINLLNPITMSV